MEPLPGRPDSPTGFPCCESPRVHVPRPLPRRAGRPSHVGRSSRPRRPSSIREETRRSHSTFRGLLRLHSRCGPHTCWPAHGGPLSPELRRLGHPHRLPGSYSYRTSLCRTCTGCGFTHGALRIRGQAATGAAQGPGSGRPNAPRSDGRERPCVHRRTSAACGRPRRHGSVPRCSSPGTRQASAQDHGHSRTAHGRGILGVPIRRSTNGCDSGTCGTVLISSISRIRRFASHRWVSNSGS